MIRKITTLFIAFLFALLVPVSIRAQVAVSANYVLDSFLRPIVTAKLCFAPVDAAANPAGFRVGSIQILPGQVCGLVSNGVMQSGIAVAPTPTGIYYHIWVASRAAGAVLRDLGMTPITGSSWTLDTYDPNLVVLPVSALSVGTVTTLSPGSGASCTIGGSGPYLLNCGIPKGDTGIPGPMSTAAAAGSAGSIQLNNGSNQMGTDSTLSYDTSTKTLSAGAVAAGTMYLTTVNPPSNGSSNLFPLISDATRYTQYVTPPASPSWASFQNYERVSSMYITQPAFNAGNPAYGQGGWAENYLHNQGISMGSAGQLYGLRINAIKNSPGDLNIFDLEGTWKGGPNAPSDEGNKPVRINAGESSTTFKGTIRTGSAGATTIKVACTSDCTNQGQGLYITEDTPVLSGYATSFTPGSGFTPNLIGIAGMTAPVSTAWGTLAANIPTSVGNPVGLVFPSISYTVNVASGTFNTSLPVCFANNHDQVIPTAATALSGGQQTLTANLRRVHAANTWVMQGGLCGTFIDFAANRAQGSVLLHFPYDIIGATNSTTLVSVWGLSVATGNISNGVTAIKSLTRHSGVVSFKSNLNSGLPSGFFAGPLGQSQASITLSSSTGGLFDGACTTQTYSQATNVGTCTQAGADTDTAAAANVTTTDPVNAGNTHGNTAFDLLAGAEVIDIQNEALAQSTDPATIAGIKAGSINVVDGTLTLEQNAVTWTPGDAVTQHHYWSATSNSIRDTFGEYNPFPQFSAPMKWTISGPGMVQSNDTGVFTTLYSNGTSMYQGFGGIAKPLYEIHMEGTTPYAGLAFSQYAPTYAGYFSYIGCPATALGCNDPNYWYYSWGAQGLHGVTGMQFTPQTSTYSLDANDCTYTFPQSLAATGFSSPCGITSNGVKNTAITSAPLLGTGSDGTEQKITLGTGLSLAGTVLNGTSTLSVPASAPLLGSTSGSALQAITVGSGLNLTGTTLSATAQSDVLCKLSTPILTQSTSTVNQSVCTIPAGTLGTSSQLAIKSRHGACTAPGVPYAICTAANTGQCVLHVMFSSSSTAGTGVTLATVSPSAASKLMLDGSIANEGAYNAQILDSTLLVGAPIHTTSNGTYTTATIATYILFGVSDSVATDYCGLDQYAVTLIP